MNDTIMPMRTLPLPKVHPAAWWLLILLTPNIGVFATGAKSASQALLLFLPSFIVLGFVAVAHLHTSATTLRWRTELRLQLTSALPLLMVSGVGVWADALTVANRDGFLETVALMASWPLGASTLIWPLTSTAEQGTLEQYATSPLGRRALIEKYAIAAALFLIAYGQLFGSAMHSEVPPFKMQFFALISAPAFALLFRRTIPALGATMIAPLFCIGVSLAVFGEAGALVTAVLFSIIAIALVPYLWKRGLLAQHFETENRFTFSLGRSVPIALATELRAQRDSVIFGLISVLFAGGVAAFMSRAEAPLAMALFSAVAAATSPALAFAEARANGTLDLELTARARRAVFLRKALTSLGVVLVVSVGLPVLTQFALGVLSVESGVSWLLAMGAVWAVSLFFSVHLRSAGTVVAASIGTLLLMFVATVAAFAVPLLLVKGVDANIGRFLTAAFALIPLLALGLGTVTFLDPAVRWVRLSLMATGFWAFSTVALAAVAAFAGSAV